jgi:hypothetical protein
MITRTLSVTALLLLATATSVAGQATPRSAGARSAGAAPAAASVLGKWEFTVEAPQGSQTMTISFERIDGALMGSGQGEFGAFQLVEVTQTGADLAFAMRFQANGQTFDIPFKGKVTGDTGEGTLSFAMGDTAPQSLPWKAKKVP